MHRMGIAALLLGAVLVAAPSSASEDEPEEKVRIYLGASGVASWQLRVEDAFTNSLVTTEMENGKPTLGAALTYGVRLARPFSVELDVEWLEGHKIEQTTVLGTNSYKIVTWTVSSILAYRPLAAWFDPFLSVGPAWMHQELKSYGATGHGLGLRFGAGADIWITDHLGLRLEGRYVLPVTSEVKDLDLVGPRAGLFYRF